MDGSLILLSGGLDSVANLYLRHHKNQLPKLALFFDYGQRAIQREWEASQYFAHYFGVELRKIELDFIKQFKPNALMDSSRALPNEMSEDSAKAVWVPNRNGVFISIAASIAEEQNLSQIVVGFNREEAQTFSDNSAGYVEAMNHSLCFSTKNNVKVVSETIEMTKKEMVQTLRRLDLRIEFDRIWSCYDGGVEPCGKCESCLRFEIARFGRVQTRKEANAGNPQYSV